MKEIHTKKEFLDSLQPRLENILKVKKISYGEMKWTKKLISVPQKFGRLPSLHKHIFLCMLTLFLQEGHPRFNHRWHNHIETCEMRLIGWCLLMKSNSLAMMNPRHEMGLCCFTSWYMELFGSNLNHISCRGWGEHAKRTIYLNSS